MSVNVWMRFVTVHVIVIPDQPDNDGSLEHYIASSARGWNDLTDIRQLTAYICEKGRTTT